MTELQPTEIEFKKKGQNEGSGARKKVLAAVAIAVFLALAATLTGLLAYRASKDPAILEPKNLPAEETVR